MAGLVWLVICVLFAVFAYFIIPDGTTNANSILVELPKQPPGTKTTVLLEPLHNGVRTGCFECLFTGRQETSRPIPVRSRADIRVSADTIFYTDLQGQEEMILLPLFILEVDKYAEGALAYKDKTGKPYEIRGDSLFYFAKNYGPATVSLAGLQASFQAKYISERSFLLGTDSFGRDVFSRLILGARVSLSVGLMAVLVSLILGIGLGALAGYFRGWVDAVIMWFVSVVWSVPTLLLAISLSFVLGKGFWQLFIAIGASMWVEVARIVRGQIFSVREMQYVEATRAMGLGNFRILLRHVLPNILSPVIIISAANFASAILIEAGLSFLGVGVQPPTPSWGSMIYEGYTQVFFDSGSWLAFFPGLAIILVVIALNLVGLGLRDALDPKFDLRG